MEWHHGPTIQELVDLERWSPFPRAVFFSSVKWERTAPLSQGPLLVPQLLRPF